MKHICAVLAALFFCAQAQAAKDPKPLFADDGVLKIRIVAPFRDLVKTAPDATDPYPATLTLLGEDSEEHAIQLSARGNSRRDPDVCDFPPLRVAFDEKPGDASLFDGQKRLKLVTHCRRSSQYQQYYALEYTAYKLFNIITPESLKVRMAMIDYVEAGSGKTVISRQGFFIEDTDDAAKRNGVKEIDVADISLAQLNATAAARYAIFQYMIGNLDWSMHNSIDGHDCCHNTKLIGARAEPLSDLSPVPYDFDYSGLVNAPYALPPEAVPVRSVRTRRYRGFCVHNDAVRAAAVEFRTQEQALFAVLDAVPGLKKSKKKSAKRYLADFFKAIADEKQLEKRLLKTCRR